MEQINSKRNIKEFAQAPSRFFKWEKVTRSCVVCIRVSTPLFLTKAPINHQTFQAPFFGNPSLYWFFLTPPTPPAPKSWIFQWTLKILKFFIPNIILSLKSN